MEGEIDIKQYIRVFFRRKWVFAAVFIGIVGFTGLRITLSPKVYIAYTKILVKKTSTILGESKILEEAFGIDTNCEILSSKGFMGRVVEDMKSEGMDYGFLSLAVAPDVLREAVRITPLKESDLIQIEAQRNDNSEVADIVNSIAKAFKNYSIEIARTKVRETRKFIEKELPMAKASLEKAEKEVQKFKENERLVSISAGGGALQSQLIRLQAEKSELRAEIGTKEKELVYMEELLKKENEKLADRIVKTDNPSLTNLRAQLLALEKEYSSYVIAGLPEDHPKLIELDEKLEKVKDDLRERVKSRSGEEILLVEPLSYPEELSRKMLNMKSTLYTLAAQKDALNERIEEMESRVESFPSKEYELAALERIYRFRENIYEKLVDRYEEAKLTEVGEIGNVVIVEEASVPTIPVSPRPFRDMIFGLIFAVAFGITSVLIKEYLDQSVKDIESLEKLQVPVIGTIPLAPNPIIDDPLSHSAEAYKKIRVNLKFSKTGISGLKTILISSCIAQEGKSTATANLSTVSANSDTKTIIVEADLRKPSLSKIFKISSKTGLSNFLVGKTSLEDVIIQTRIENLFIIPAGHIPPNPSELIDSGIMRSLLSELSQKFDAIFIDSPPLANCADGFLLGTMVDGVILIMELGKTQKGALMQMISSFNSTGASFLGVVPNRVKRPIYYKYPYYYKYYGTYKGSSKEA